MSLLGCGATQVSLSQADRDGLRDRAGQAHSDNGTGHVKKPRRRKSRSSTGRKPDSASEMTALPRPSAGSLWADAISDNQADAFRQARRMVSEQVVAQLSSESQTVDSSFNGQETSDAMLKVKIKSQFRHAELIRPVGVIRKGRDFVARVALDRDEAIEAYKRDIESAKADLKRAATALDGAIARKDTSILLSRRWSPAYLAAKIKDDIAVLGALGARYTYKPNPRLVRLMKTAAALRSQSVIKLRVSGDVPDSLKRAVVGQIAKTMAKQNCKFAADRPSSTAPDSPTAKAHLRIASRKHLEYGTQWRYLGFELYAVDARSGSPLVHVSALPEFVHGGGPNWAMADQAVVRRLGKKLNEKYGAALAEVICR